MKKILVITTVIMFTSLSVALLKEKEYNDYNMESKMNDQIFHLEEKKKDINNQLDEARSIQNNNKDNNIEKINELELWQKQIEKIKSYL